MILSNENITIGTLTVLKHLGITTYEQLKEFKPPKINELIYYNPLARIERRYTKKVDNEIKELLNL